MKEQSIARIFIGVSTFITQSLMIFFFLKVIQPVFSQNAVLASPAQVRVSTSKSYKDEISAEADP
jgi:hypothetical protein